MMSACYLRFFTLTTLSPFGFIFLQALKSIVGCDVGYVVLWKTEREAIGLILYRVLMTQICFFFLEGFLSLRFITRKTHSQVEFIYIYLEIEIIEIQLYIMFLKRVLE